MTFLGDFNIPISFRKVQTILSRKPTNRLEKIIHKVSDLFQKQTNLDDLVTEYDQILALFPFAGSGNQMLFQPLQQLLKELENFQTLANVYEQNLSNLSEL